MKRASWKRAAALVAGCCSFTATLIPADHSYAGCRCRSSAFAAPGDMAPYAADPEFHAFAAGAGVGPIAAGYTGLVPTPPPGTLGQTYLRMSRPVPKAKHPRAGLLDVRAPGASSVSVQWTNPFSLDDELSGFVDARDATIWHFESPQLIPGVAQVYRVEARYGTGADCVVREKYVRLIMGRVVNVTFRPDGL